MRARNPSRRDAPGEANATRLCRFDPTARSRTPPFVPTSRKTPRRPERFSVLARLRGRLLARDEADALAPVPSRYEQSAGGSKKGEPDGTLTAALLEGGDAGSIASGASGAVTKEGTGTPNWWDAEGG